MFDIHSEARAIRVERHEAQVRRNRDAADLMRAARVLLSAGLIANCVQLEAVADQIVAGEL